MNKVTIGNELNSHSYNAKIERTPYGALRRSVYKKIIWNSQLAGFCS